MKHWTEIVNQLNHQNCPYVLVTILGVRGSAPRNNGTKMIVTSDQTYATIGGGQLEHLVTHQAREMFSNPNNRQHLEYYPLGPKLNQCCGGSTTVLFEYFSKQYADLMLFGAGHVGQALSKVLTELPLRLHWVDNRKEQFLKVDTPLKHANCRTIVSNNPKSEIDKMPTDSYYIIMTHDHQLDFDLCCAILKRGDARFIGLIGSNTKWLRFQKRLKLKGFDQRQIDQIQCPVGLDSVPGKRPMEVAVSVASEIIADYHRKQYRETEFDQKSQGKAWQQLAQQQISSLDASSDTGKTRSIDRSKACGGCDEC